MCNSPLLEPRPWKARLRKSVPRNTSPETRPERNRPTEVRREPVRNTSVLQTDRSARPIAHINALRDEEVHEDDAPARARVVQTRPALWVLDV